MKIKGEKSLVSFLIFLIITSSLWILFTPQKARATDYTISSATTWCDADDLPSDIGNLTIDSGVTLTIGGSTGNAVNGYKGGAPTDACSYSSTSIPVNISGALAVNGTLTVVGEYSTDMNGIAPTFTVTGNVTVAVTTGSITSSGQGYDGGSTYGRGPGGGDKYVGFGCAGGGGGYGGIGGGATGCVATPTYGSALTPLDLGSGGGGPTGGDGGGAIRIISSGTVTVSGSITANGAAGSGTYRGAGSGGSIYITAATLAGSGTITVNGGGTGDSNGGGGGRIALYYSTSNTYSGTPTANGGTGTSANGTNGSAIIIDSTNRDLTIVDDLVLEPASGNDLDGTTRFDGVYNFRNVTVNSGNTLTFKGTYTTDMDGYGPTLKLTGNLTVTGSITANGQGYDGGSTYGRGPGGGDKFVGGGCAGGGGGYGGIGGGATGCVATPTYGSALTPLDLGSGGGGPTGGDGGGAIRIISSGTITVSGSITANGTEGSGTYKGGGSGGSIYVTVATLSGVGTITTNGANSASGNGGGGGRIALYYTTSNTYSGTPTANGGTGGAANGANGTVTGPSQITVTNNLGAPTLLSPYNAYTTNNTTPNFVWEPPVDYFANITQYGLVVDSETEVVAYEPFYQWTSALATGAHTWKVRAGDGTNWGSYTATKSFTVDTGSTSGNLSLSSSISFECDGDNYLTATTQASYNSGPYCTYTFDEVTISNSSTITFPSHYATYTKAINDGRGVVLNAKSVTVNTGSSISINEEGFSGPTIGSYVSGRGPGAGNDGSSSGGGGGGYGGAGGNGYNSSSAGGAIYGSSIVPKDLGSSGGRNGSNPGSGGGTVWLLISGATTVSGSITSNGGNGVSSSGAGSGGSVYITTGTVTGAGSITANGGNAAGAGVGSGGGGRVAIYRASGSAFSGTLTANGGTTGNVGSVGSLAQIDSTNNDLTFSNSLTLNSKSGRNTNSSKRTDGVYQFRNVTINSSSTITLDCVYFTYTLAVSDKQCASFDITGDLTIDSGSSMSSNSKGYLSNTSVSYSSGRGPGAGNDGSSSGGGGGGYGGAGGNGYNSSSAGGITYGSSASPTHLGSAGGHNNGTGGHGGGYVRLNIGGALTVTGSITANGGTATNSDGAGSGGSVYITTGTVTGAGSITANGGNAAGAGVGSGGGGRVAIYRASGSAFSGTLTANGGTTGNVGSAGTTTQDTAPTAPTSFAGTVDSATQITWSWADASTNEDSFKLHNGSHTVITTVTSTTEAGTGTSYNYAESGLSVNTQYTRHVHAYDAAMGNGAASSSVSKYTLANVPSAPTVNGAASTSLNVAINVNSNPASTEFAIYTSTTTQYVQTDGTLGASAVWATNATWGTKTVTGLDIGRSYSFQVKARNGDNTETSLSSAASAATTANAPGTPTVARNNSTSLNVKIAINSNHSSVEYAIYNNITSTYVQADGTLGASAVWQTYTNWGGASGINNTGLSINTQYTYKVKARNGDATETAFSSNSTAIYTDAATPGTPTLSAVNSTTINVIIAQNSNPSSVVYAIAVSTSTGDSNPNYVQANGTVGASAIWQSYTTWGGASGVNNTGLTQNTRYYYRVKARNSDSVETSFGSEANEVTPIPPVAPTEITLKDISDASYSRYRLSLNWTADTNALRDYDIIERSTNGTDYSQLTTTASSEYSNLSLSQSITYYYRIKTHLSNGDTSSASSVVSMQPASSDTVAPTISAITTGDPGSTSVTITWSTNEAANSIVDYGTDTNYGTSAGNSAASTTSHSVTINNLNANTAYKYRVKSRDAAGNLTTDNNGGAGYGFTTDANEANVPTGSVVANNGASYTTSATVNLRLNGSDTGGGYVQYMKFSNDNVTYSSYETFTGYKSWDVTNAVYGGNSNQGTKTVYVIYKDSYSNESIAYSDTIVYDTSSPSANTPSGTTPNTDTTPTWSWSASTDTNSIDGYYIKIGTTDGGSDTLSETFIGNVTSYTAVTALSDGTYYAAIKAKDSAGNTGSYGSSGSLAVDATAPTSGTISIDSGASYTTDATVALTLSATSATYMQFSNAPNGTYSDWEAYSTSKTSWDITSATYGGTSTEETKRVYVRYKDNAGNISPVYNDGIVYDGTAATNGSILIDNAAAYTIAATVDLTLNAKDENSGIYQMKFSNNGTTWSTYEAYSTSKSDWDVTSATYGGNSNQGTKTVYAKFKDNAGNETSSSITDTITYDTSSPSANTPSGTTPNTDTTPTWSWSASTDTNGIDGYYIKIGTTDGGSNTLSETFIGNVISYTAVTALSDGTYYAAIKAKDSAGNTGSYGSSGSLAVDATAPTSGTISIDAGASYTTDVTVDLTLSATSATYMQFSNAPNGTYSDWEAYSTSKTSWDITSATYGGTSTEETKRVYVRYKDNAGNISPVYNDGIVYDGTAATQSSIAASSGSAGATATVTWTTSEAATSGVYYDTTSRSNGVYTDYTSSSTDSDQDTNHSISLSSLSTGTTYYYRVRSVDAAGNAAVSTEKTFTTVTFPTASNVASSSATNEGAVITWNTNVNADSYVKYGTTADYGALQGIDNSVTSHTVNLVGLLASNIYHYAIKSKDAYGNVVTSADGTFTTAAAAAASESITSAVVSSSTAKDIITGEVTITWATSATSSSYVEYGTTTGYGSEQGENDTVTSHSVTLKGLAANTTYHYRAKSIDKDGNILVSADSTFATGSVTQPSLSAVAAGDITLTEAVITWKTSKTASTQVKYDTETNYDSNGVLGLISSLDSSPNTSHSVKLTNLESGKKYYFRVVSIDSSTNDELISNLQNFTTITFPEISNIALNNKDLDSKSAKISWKTNVETDTFVEFGQTTELGEEQGSSTLATEHSHALNNLTDNTQYYYKVKGRDIYGNLAISSIHSFTTKTDTDLPIVSDVKSEISSVGTGESTRIQLIISWSTDEEATSQVEWEVGLGDDYPKQTLDDTVLNRSHMVIIPELLPSTTYHFRVRSVDKAGNVAVSDKLVILTPEQEESIVQVIIKTLEDIFSFLTPLFKR